MSQLSCLSQTTQKVSWSSENLETTFSIFTHQSLNSLSLYKRLRAIILEHEKIIAVIVFENILSSPSSVCVYTYTVAEVLVMVAVLVVGVVVVILVVYYFGKTLIIPLSSIKHLLLALTMLSMWGNISGQVSYITCHQRAYNVIY